MHRVFLRVLLFIYQKQQSDLKWGGKFSTRFSVKNGVRQGAVSSPLLLSVFIDDLFKLLWSCGLGCYISNVFLACFGHADDLIILSASRSGLLELVKICEKFVKGLKFSSNVYPKKSKTKCIIFSRKPVDSRKVSPIVLNHDPLPWVPNVNHLGNVFQCDNKIALTWPRKEESWLAS